MASNVAWEKIFKAYNIGDHDFAKKPFFLSSGQIKDATRNFRETRHRESRILCKQDTRSDRPDVFVERGLFILPVKNGHYAIIQGEGYMDIPAIHSKPITYKSKLNFELETTKIGNSEMQHLDLAYASSIIRTFMNDPSLVLTIRGRKYSPQLSFKVGENEILVESVQTEVDAGYEGEEQIVLVEAKNRNANNTIIRQLYYPFKQWTENSSKKVITLFFDKDHEQDLYRIWHFEFTDPNDYNSIQLVRSERFKMSK